MENVFVMIEHNDEAVQVGKKPHYGFSIRATPTIIKEIMRLPNQIPTPVGLFLPFGSKKQYLQTWSNDLNFKDVLLSLGLREVCGDSEEGLRFLVEWKKELDLFIMQSQASLTQAFYRLSRS